MSWYKILADLLIVGITCQLAICQLAAQSENQTKQDSKQQIETGQLVGSLVDPRGQKVYGGHVAVFLCDAETGLSINRETKRPITPTLRDPQLDKLWFVETSERGRFEFDAVPVGKYRLVAQSWSGTQGFSGFDTNRHPSAFVVLHGVADDIEVQAGKKTSAYPRQLGNHVLRIMNDPEEPHALLLISLHPTLGDGILGPFGWGSKFCRELIGFTQMELGYVTIIGLPADASVHVGLMNYDNNPGVGAASFKPGQQTGTLRVIASWSNGKKDPPPELEKITSHLADNNIELEDILDQLGIQAEDARSARLAVLELLDRENDYQVDIEGMGMQPLADVLAGFGYVRMRKFKR